MTEFTLELRHFCRNPRCRMKLPQPVSNEREAFCTRGCHSSFYRKRCLVCEGEMERKTEHQRVCGKRRCRNALQGPLNLGRYVPSSVGVSPVKNPIKSDIKSGDPATVPDGPGCRWEGGAYRRIEANNKATLREHFRKKAAECLVQPHHPPVNILGGYRFPDAPIIGLSPLHEPLAQGAVLSDWKPCLPSDWESLPDLPIPMDWLRDQAAASIG